MRYMQRIGARLVALAACAGCLTPGTTTTVIGGGGAPAVAASRVYGLTLDEIIAACAGLFPNAQLGIGEYGKRGDAAILQHYLRYVPANPRFIFAGLYWYGRQDLVPHTQPLWRVFRDAMAGTL